MLENFVNQAAMAGTRPASYRLSNKIFPERTQLSRLRRRALISSV
jgi:hypothetical protein